MQDKESDYWSSFVSDHRGLFSQSSLLSLLLRYVLSGLQVSLASEVDNDRAKISSL